MARKITSESTLPGAMTAAYLDTVAWVSVGKEADRGVVMRRGRISTGD
jgi:hypothetical protein